MIYLNNLKRLSEKFSEEDTKYLFYLSKKNTENISKKDIKRFVKNVIKENYIKKIYDNKSLKKVLYYRYFVSNLKRLSFFDIINCIVYSNLIGLYINKKIKIIKCKKRF